MTDLSTIVARAKRKGFMYPGSDIYGGLANARDYGPYATQLKKNIADLRWKLFVNQRQDMIGLDAQILMHPTVREASGHTSNFDDPLIDDKISKERFRADKIIEDKLESWRNTGKSDSEIRAMIHQDIHVNNLTPESWSFDHMRDFIRKHVPKNPSTGKKADWTDVRKFQMMFYTYQGVIHDEKNKIRLRPETAQGIFVNFKNVLDTTRMRIPFGIAQIGKAFRNEITPGNFTFRTREFEQMEIEYFVPADTQKAREALHMRKDICKKRRLEHMQLDQEKIRFREHESEELSHYSDMTFDVEYKFPRGRGELQGIAYRTDFDLSSHQKFSGIDLRYTDPHTGERYIPHVIEPSMGLSRATLTVMLNAYDEEEYKDANNTTQTRVVARFPDYLAPVQYAILPLIKKDEQQIAIAEELYKKLAGTYSVEYDDGGAIGKRYRRQDEIGTPYCLTVDHQSKEDGTITIRYRDSMEQRRCTIEELIEYSIGR